MRRHALFALVLLSLVAFAFPVALRADDEEVDTEESMEESIEEEVETDEAESDSNEGEEADESEDPDETPEWVVTFTNGDAIRCRLIGFDRETFRFASAFAEGRELAVPLGRVVQIEQTGSRAASDEVSAAIAAAPHKVDLRRGTTLTCKVTSFDASSVVVEIPGLGSVTLPWPEVAMFRLTSVDASVLAVAPPEKSFLLTSGGDVLQGSLTASADGTSLVIRSEGVEATVDFAVVTAFVLAEPAAPDAKDGDAKEGEEEDDEAKDDDDAADAATGPLEVRLGLVGGLEIPAIDPTSDGETLTFKLGNGEPIELPIAHAKSLIFGEGVSRLAGRRAVFVWGAYADRDQEYQWTRDLAKTHLGGYEIVESFTETFDAEFRKQLFRSRALLIPEMEAWKHGAGAKQAQALEPIVKAYLRAGGRIVVCGITNSHTEFLRRAGIIDVSQKGGSADGKKVTPTALGARYFRGLKGGFVAKNATHFLQHGSTFPGTGSYAEAEGGAVIIGRRIGRGMAFAIGSDFYQRTPELGKVLANLLVPSR